MEVKYAMKISKENSQAYDWGINCKGWHLVNTPALSVIQEVMPPATVERSHKHSKSQQFFYILRGEATFSVDGKTQKVKRNQGIYIPPNVFHQIRNATDEDLEFLVISQPHAHGDRILAE